MSLQVLIPSELIDINANEVVNEYSEDRLIDIFRMYSEDKHSKKIAKQIFVYEKSKKNQKIQRTFCPN